MTISDGLRNSEDFLNAVHEAGHAIAWAVLDLGLVAVTVDATQIAKFPETSRVGFTTSGLTISLPVSALTAEQRITVGLCGMLAEIKARTGETRLTDFEGVKEVLSRAEDDLEEILATGVDSEQAADAAVNIIERNWEAIEVVALRLITDKTMDAETVATIVEICR
jgi:hypothetical protein